MPFDQIEFQTIHIILLPARSNSTSTTNTVEFSAIYSAFITAGVVFLVGILTFLYNRASLAESKRKERRGSITKKLNEFYGPLNSYLKITVAFNDLLKKNKPQNFRTLIHLLNPSRTYENNQTIDWSESDKKIIAEIIDIEKKIEELVNSKSGLIDDSEQADLLAKAITHFRILRLAYNGEISGGVERFESYVYPRELDTSVEKKIKALKEELDKISTPGWIEKFLFGE